MPLVSLLDLEKSLNVNSSTYFSGSKEFDSIMNASNLINNQTRLLQDNSKLSININNNNNTNNQSVVNNANLLLQQKLLLNSLKNDYLNTLLSNSTTLINANSLQSLLLNTNLINNLNTNLVSNTLNAATNITANASNTNSNNSSKQINYSRYKTELCRQFNENGECKYGDKCQFAHGFVDLKDVNRHPKYKTDFCKTFHSKGFCPYGPRCHFIHDLSEKFDSQIPNIVTTSNSKAQIEVSSAADLMLASKLKQQKEIDKNQVEDYVMSLSMLSNSSSSLSPSASSSSSTSSLSNKSISSHSGNNNINNNINSNLIGRKTSDEDEDEDEVLSDPFQYSNQASQLELNNLLLSSPIQNNQFATQLSSYHQQRSRSMTSSTSSAYSSASSTSSINSYNFNDLNPIKLNKHNTNSIVDEKSTNQLLKTSTFDFFFP